MGPARRPRLGHVAALLLAATIPVRPFLADPPAPPPLEYQVKAAFVYNFAKFVDWPAAAFASADAPLAICAIADERFETELDRAVRGKRVGTRSLVMRRLASDDPLDACHVLVLEMDGAERLGVILAKVRQRPVLTVGQHREFIPLGGVIDFTRQGDRIRFQINVDAAARAGLPISSKLLSVAQVVRDPRAPEDRK